MPNHLLDPVDPPAEFLHIFWHGNQLKDVIHCVVGPDAEPGG